MNYIHVWQKQQPRCPLDIRDATMVRMSTCWHTCMRVVGEGLHTFIRHTITSLGIQVGSIGTMFPSCYISSVKIHGCWAKPRLQIWRRGGILLTACRWRSNENCTNAIYYLYKQ